MGRPGCRSARCRRPGSRTGRSGTGSRRRCRRGGRSSSSSAAAQMACRSSACARPRSLRPSDPPTSSVCAVDAEPAEQVRRERPRARDTAGATSGSASPACAACDPRSSTVVHVHRQLDGGVLRRRNRRRAAEESTTTAVPDGRSPRTNDMRGPIPNGLGGRRRREDRGDDGRRRRKRQRRGSRRIDVPASVHGIAGIGLACSGDEPAGCRSGRRYRALTGPTG